MPKSIQSLPPAASGIHSHALGGWLSASAVTIPSAGIINQMAPALNTSLAISHAQHESAAGLCTGSLVQGEGGVMAAVLGDIAELPGGAPELLRKYQQLGPECTDGLSGAFACYVLDPQTHTAVVASDRLGRLPLYYSANAVRVVFGSSASVVLAHPDVQDGITEAGIYAYVYFHMIPSPLSIHREVAKLPAAHRLVWRSGQWSCQRYWMPTFSNASSKADSREQTFNTLRQCVEDSASGEASTASFLSGGLDSSTVTGFLTEARAGDADAYSIGFDADGYDEMAYARITAKHFGTRLHEYYVTPEDVVEALPRIAQSYDEPFGNSSALPAWFCARTAADKGVKRLLAGDGGDELFAGNERYAHQLKFERWLRLPALLRDSMVAPLVKALPDSFPLASKGRSFLRQASTPLPDRTQTYNFLHQHDPAELFQPDFLATVDCGAPDALLRDYYHAPESASALNRMLYMDWQITLADNDLRKVSHMCALAGVDVRYPMLDDRLIDLSCTIPDDWKLQGNNLRAFYKETFSNWLPDATINKSKHGFGLPFGVWMQNHADLQAIAYDNLLALKKRHFFRSDFIDRVVDLHREGHASYYGELVWILSVLELWLSRPTGAEQ